MTSVVFGSSNSNFTCFRNLRCLDQKVYFSDLQRKKSIFRIFAEKCSDNAACEEPTK